MRSGRFPVRLRRSRAGAPPSLATDLALAAVVVGIVASLAVLAVIAPRGIPGVDYYNVTAQFHNAASITPFSEVRMAGKRVGQVTKIEHRRGMALVHLQLDPSIRPLPEDTTARIRLKGLLGAKFVDLTRGTRGDGVAQDGTIPLAQTSTTVELFDVLDLFDKRRRESLGETVRGLGTGFLGRGQDLNDSLGDARPTFQALTAFAGAVNRRTGAAERFFPSLEAAARAYDPVREDLARGFRPQATALQPFVDRRPALQAALEAAPSALEDMRRGLERDDPMLEETRRFAVATIEMTARAPEAFREAGALLRDSRVPLRRASTLLRQTARAVPPTLQLTSRVDPLIAPASRSLQNSTPGFRELSRRPCDVLGMARNWRSVLSYGIPIDDPIGYLNMFRVEYVANPEPANYARNPYPAPCQAGTEKVR